jgi:hypothetical protein
MKKYRMFEISVSGPTPSVNEAQPDCRAIFQLNGRKTAVRGFWDGHGSYCFRYLPEETGTLTWTLGGCVSGSGSEEVTEAAPAGHGKVTVNGTHFRYEDGTKYYPFGTTIYAMIHQPDERVKQTLQTLASTRFNKVRLCIFPKWYDYNHRDPELYAFRKNSEGRFDPRLPDPDFWDRFDKILDQMEALGIEADLILFHPYDKKEWNFSGMSMEDNMIYLDYCIRRLAARPNIWWSLANEFDLIHQRTDDDWYAFEDFIHENDPFHHLLSAHACMRQYDYTRPHITHVSFQSQDVAKTSQFIAKYKKPVIFDEMCYEGNLPMNWGNISAFEMVHRFWCCVSKGGYGTHGETFLSDDDILWWAAGGVLKGQSAPRIGWLRDIVESLPGPLDSGSGEDSTNIVEQMMNNPELVDVYLKDQPEETKLFARSLCRMSDRDREDFLMKNNTYESWAGKSAYLRYFGHTCPGITTVNLPAEHTYKIEVLDAWEMTRTTAAEHVNGSVQIRLPGKEGFAVLATADD